MQARPILLVGLQAGDREKVLQALDLSGLMRSQVQEVFSGSEALKICRARPFTLIILDQFISDMSWLELVRLMGEHKWKMDARLVLLADLSRTDLRACQEAAGLGLDEICFKPLDQRELAARVRFRISHSAYAGGCQQHFVSTASRAGLGYWEYNPLTGHFFLSPSAMELLGYTPGQEPMESEVMQNHLSPGDMNNLESRLRTLAPDKLFSMDLSFRRRDREERFIRIQGQMSGMDSPGVISGVFQDVTQQKRVENKLVELLEQTSMQAEALEQSGEGIVLTDSSLKVVYVNPFFDETSGFKASELITKLKESMYADMEPGGGIYEDRDRAPLRKQLTLVDKNDYTREVEVSVSPVKNKQSGVIVNYVLMVRDITERQHLQKQLQQAQKMEAIGTLAGGIAHDFNNSLMGIQGFTELALLKMPDHGRSREYLQSALGTVQRARDLVQQILTFSGQKETVKAPMQVEPVLKEALKLLGATVPANIQVNSDIEEDTPMVTADPVWIHQIAMNLCTNALQAMPKGGDISVGLKVADLNDFCMEAGHDLAPGRYLLLEVQDSGYGMEPEILERIFDPFFSTKPRGKGTGLGLSVVHGIVQELAGHIEVVSTPGKGSLFRVYIPALQEAAVHVPASARLEYQSGGMERGRGSILFVDDQEDIVLWGVRALESLGYKVRGISSGEQALEMLRRDPDGYDLLVTDLSMPGMSGEDLVKSVRGLRPGLPIIMCTGHAGADIQEHCGSQADAVMQKPFSMGEFSRLIRSLLQEG